MEIRITEAAQLPVLFQQRLNSGDVEGLLTLFTPDATMRTTTGAMITGHAALHREFTETISAAAELVNRSRHTLLSADTALLVTDWTLHLTTPDGTRISPTGTTANIAVRTDGEWRFALLNPLGIA